MRRIPKAGLRPTTSLLAAGLFAARLCAAILLAGGVSWQAAAADPGFTAPQRQEIIEIIRDAMRKDPSILRDAVTALQQDEARQQETAASQTIAALTPALTQNAADPVAGNPKGDVTLVEFYDVRCPYCRRMVSVIDALIKSDPNLRIVYKDLPVLGPGSVAGARALLAAQKQGGYLKLHALLMGANPSMDDATLQTAVKQAGLDWARLKQDMDDPDVKLRIDANLALSHQLDIQGTPAYVIGGKLLPGAVELAELQDAVAAARKK